MYPGYILANFQVSRFKFLQISRYSGLYSRRYPGILVYTLAHIQVSRFISTQISWYPGFLYSLQIFRYPIYIFLADIQVSRFIYSLQIFRYLGLYPCRYQGIQVYILVDIQVSRYSMQISRYLGLYIPCRYPGIQVYIFLADIQVSRFIYSL